MIKSVDEALTSLDEAILSLKGVTEGLESSIVVSVAIYNEHSGEVKEFVHCSGYTDIVAMQIEGINEHIAKHADAKCRCGRINLRL